MKQYKLGLVVLLLLVAISSEALARPRFAQPGKATTLYYYLDQLGTEYDCYFTVEASWEEGEITKWMEGYKLERLAKKDTVYAELESLSKTVPHFAYTVDGKNPKIIHVIDARLLNKMDYALERPLERINFTGTLPDLVKLIGQQGIPISSEIAIFTSDYRPRDRETKVEVKGEGIKVKEALTDSITLTGRGRVLWVARTKLAPSATTFIEFFGAAPKSGVN